MDALVPTTHDLANLSFVHLATFDQ